MIIGSLYLWEARKTVYIVNRITNLMEVEIVLSPNIKEVGSKAEWPLDIIKHDRKISLEELQEMKAGLL